MSFFKNLLGRKDKGKQPKSPAIGKDAFLKSKPVRNPAIEWNESDDGEVTLILKKEVRKTGLFSGFVKTPSEKKVILDEVGGFVWRLCDGENRVGEIVDKLSSKYNLHRREAEASLNLYLEKLAKRRFVGFIVPKEVAEKLSKLQEKGRGSTGPKERA